jgi:hypothetical protein
MDEAERIARLIADCIESKRWRDHIPAAEMLVAERYGLNKRLERQTETIKNLEARLAQEVEHSHSLSQVIDKFEYGK